jgi:hypothetical protein
VATTGDKDDVDGGPLWGCYWRVQQRPLPRLKKMSIAGPLGGAAGESDSNHH